MLSVAAKRFRELNPLSAKRCFYFIIIIITIFFFFFTSSPLCYVGGDDEKTEKLSTAVTDEWAPGRRVPIFQFNRRPAEVGN